MNASYDSRADVLAIRMRMGEPRYVVVGRGTFVIFADEEGIWGVDLEAESWDQDVIYIFNRRKAHRLPRDRRRCIPQSRRIQTNKKRNIAKSRH
jgi:hypothetical protein